MDRSIDGLPRRGSGMPRMASNSIDGSHRYFRAIHAGDVDLDGARHPGWVSPAVGLPGQHRRSIEGRSRRQRARLRCDPRAEADFEAEAVLEEEGEVEEVEVRTVATRDLPRRWWKPESSFTNARERRFASSPTPRFRISMDLSTCRTRPRLEKSMKSSVPSTRLTSPSRWMQE